MGKFTVIGMGNFGYHVTKCLFNEGHEVLAIDSDRNLIQSISPLCSQAIEMDATDKEALETLGLENMDGVLVCVGNSLSNSILISLHLNEIGVKRIIVKALDDDHAKILRKIGVTDVIHPEREMAARLAKSLSHPNIIDFIPISEDFEVLQLTPPDDFQGKTLRDLNLRSKYGIQVIAVKHGDSGKNELIPEASYIVNSKDSLVILGENKNIKKIRSLNKK
ncbi:MAG: TrkA family potassium uptake protein [Spirochaetales bacterium]|nr:TrkA family potassium uptake protein [Spirochaetales bacterium]